jgi:hypothetical protein
MRRKKSIRDALKAEMRFFGSHPIYKYAPPAAAPALTDRLALPQVDRLALGHCLPGKAAQHGVEADGGLLTRAVRVTGTGPRRLLRS